jgi:3-oxoacyl-[acyl-carrier protein] reductase
MNERGSKNVELSLEGKVALVTGASRDIGSTVARRLAEAGADVAVGYGGDRGSAEKLVSEIERTGRRAVARPSR